jgi:hypothetical protein
MEEMQVFNAPTFPYALFNREGETMKVTDYQIVDYGIDNAQYFQGHGTAFTKYDHAALGGGDSYCEALTDALGQAAQCGAEIELATEDLPEQPANNAESAWERHCQYCDQEDHDNCDSELYYYVGLRWNA